jgi:endogenous inhibitor of DNA gyrase (YacG/DUF329 family)
MESAKQQGVLYSVDGDCSHEKRKKEMVKDKNGNERQKVTCASCGKFIEWGRIVENDNFIMPFGKYRGSRLIDLETDYLQWMADNMKGSLRKRAIEVMKGRDYSDH